MKIAFFEKEFPEANFNIAAFLETHHKDTEDFPVVFKEFEKTHYLVHTPTASGTHGGIVIFISRKNYILDRREMIPGRLLNVKFVYKASSETFNLSVFTGPSGRRKGGEKWLK